MLLLADKYRFKNHTMNTLLGFVFITVSPSGLLYEVSFTPIRVFSVLPLIEYVMKVVSGSEFKTGKVTR
ncbi:MAG: hypothetical protein GXO89_01845 [Chlorobi bacterium]|nr:hypothetical protein [Chlorobiota bacterium]